MTHILIVEDETRVADFLARGLRAEGYTPMVARNGPEALETARTREFAAILLDLRLPGMSGQDVCQELRTGGDTTPILMLTAMDTIDDKVQGLKLGADDYLTKPFSFDELLARIAALIRRNRSFTVQPTRLEVGGIVFDRETLTVEVAGQKVELTAKELALLELFLSAPGRVFSRTRILNNVWGYTADPLTNVVDVYVRRLRKKLDGPHADAAITTVRGYGYRLEPHARETTPEAAGDHRPV